MNALRPSTSGGGYSGRETDSVLANDLGIGPMSASPCPAIEAQTRFQPSSAAARCCSAQATASARSRWPACSRAVEHRLRPRRPPAPVPSVSSSCSCMAAHRRSTYSTPNRCSPATLASRCHSRPHGSPPARRASCSPPRGSSAGTAAAVPMSANSSRTSHRSPTNCASSARCTG